MTINDMTDAQLAAMVRNSCYARNTRFGDGHNDARFLLVLAVPYGPDEDVETLGEAMEGFRDLLTASDWDERQFQIYDHKAGNFFETSYETLLLSDEDEADNGQQTTV